MADRVKYFLLGLLFLVVAGVIAYDRWNSHEGLPEGDIASGEQAANKNNMSTIFIGRDIDEENAPEKESVLPEPELDDAPPFEGGDLDLGPPNRTVKEKPYIPVRPEPKPSSKRVHVVKGGEALEKISRIYYESGDVYKGIQLIVKANSLANPNHISEGQSLIIPAMASSAPRRKVEVLRTPNTKRTEPGSTKPTPKKKATGVPSVYVVKKSDGDLYKICRRFYGRTGEGARIPRIMAANNLWSVNVKPGTKLKLPKR